MTGKTDFNDIADAVMTRQIVAAAMRKTPPPRFVITPIRDIKAVLSGQWLIKHLLPAQGLAVVYGPPGCGKSFVTLNAALHIAMGRDWAGKKVRQAAVIYIAAEGGHGFGNRVVAARARLNVPDDVPFGLITVAPNLGSKKGDAQRLIKEIQAQTAELGWTLGAIVIDTLARVMGGADENSSEGMGAFIENTETVSRMFHCLGIAVHHTGKDAEKGMRGWSGLHGAADAEWEISEDDAGKTVRTSKQKDGADNLLWRFKLVPVEIGQDEDGENVSSVHVLITSDVEAVKQKSDGKNVSKKKPKGQKALALKAVWKAIDEAGEIMPASNHMPAVRRGVRRQAIQIYAEKLGFLDGKSERVARSTLDRLLRELAGDSHIGRWGEWVWTIDETE